MPFLFATCGCLRVEQELIILYSLVLWLHVPSVRVLRSGVACCICLSVEGLAKNTGNYMYVCSADLTVSCMTETRKPVTKMIKGR